MSDTSVAVVTGAARGLGLAAATALAATGRQVILCDIDAKSVESAAAQMRLEGAKAHAVAVDVADPMAVSSCFQKIKEIDERIDILINAAGIQGLVEGLRPRVEDIPFELWTRTLGVNLTGVFLMCKGAIPLMKANRHGRIVNIASRAARMRTANGNSNYAAAKAGVIGFSRVLAGELGPFGITVNCVAPSRVATNMTLDAKDSDALIAASVKQSVLGRLCEPGDVVNGIVFLCSDEASFITGSVLDINGGSYMA